MSHDHLYRLTEHEQRVLPYFAAGMTHQQIAEALGLSVSTVEWYRHGIMQKLPAANKAQMAVWALITKQVEPAQILDIWRQHLPHMVPE